MLVIEGRNVNDIYQKGYHALTTYGQREPSRNGDVLVTPAPVMSIYHKPCERVLFDPIRDANPFFHLMEAIWMIAGRNDSAFLNQFVRDYGSRFAEEDGYVWGAYGARWRHHFIDVPNYDPHDAPLPYIDQVQKCVELLRQNPKDRRVVISMWDPQMDLGVPKRDVPCNTQLYPRIVNGCLDLTIMCRSNDIIWGAYGANAVHFSFLQEVMAAGVGCEVGIMYQLSNNWHGYVDIMKKQTAVERRDPYMIPGLCNLPLVDDYGLFYEECEIFCTESQKVRVWNNSFFETTAVPMYLVHRTFKEHGARRALEEVKEIGAPDWRLIVGQWLERRIK